MKHLQKFPIINESRSQSIDEEKFKEILKTKCSNWSINNQQIYRGTSASTPFRYINPLDEPRERVSIDNDGINIYYIILTNSDEWSKFPKRKNSIIATNDTDILADYAQYDEDDNMLYYVVIPFDDTMWGVTPKNDLWFSYTRDELGVKQLQEFNHIIVNTLSKLSKQYRIHIDTLEDLKTVLKSIDWSDKENIANSVDEIHRTLKNEAVSAKHKYIDSIVCNTLESFKSSDSSEEALDVILHSLPTDEFKLLKYDKGGFKLEGSHELWSEGESLMIRIDSFRKMFNL